MRRGTIIKRGKSYSVVLDIGRDMETARRRRRWHSGFRTRREAERALTELLGRLDKGTYVEPSRQTLAEFVEDWLPAIRGTIRTSTWESYAANLRAHVLPVLGSVELQALGPAQLNRLYADLRESGRRDGKGGLSPKTVRYCHTIVRRLLRDAVKWGKLTRNVADSADPPKQTARRREMKTWRADELRSFLESVRDSRLYPAWLVLSTTGMRRGELLGLRWEDVELEAGRLSIRQSLVASGKYEPRFEEPKTDRGRRSIPLAPETAAALRSWHAQQAQERLAWGPAWHDTGLVFTREDGTPIHPDRFSKLFGQLVRAAGLLRIRLHDLRHTFATLALCAGVPAKVVSEILGHASIAITLDVYSHAVPALQEDATARVAGLVFGGS